MNNDRFALETEIPPLTKTLSAWAVLTFGIFFLAGPALESGSDLLVYSLLAVQALAIVKATPLLRELLCDRPRLTVDDEGLGFRHLGDDWLRPIAWSRVVRWEVLPGTLLVEYSETKEEEGGVEVMDLAYATHSAEEVRAALEAATTLPENVVPLRKAA
jgi:hypothetical protein